MAKRIKTVFSKPEPVAALWAKQAQSHAAYVYYSGGGRFAYVPKGTPRDRITAVFSEGRNLYSYGHHYLLGRIMQFNGKKVAVVNFTKYSSITTGHSYTAYRAAKDAGLVVAEVNAFDGDRFNYDTTDAELCAAIESNIERESNSLYDSLQWLTLGKNGAYYVRHIRENVAEFNSMVSALGLKERRIDVPDSFYKECLELGKIVDKAGNDHAKRRQCAFNFSAQSPKELVEPTHWETRSERRKVS